MDVSTLATVVGDLSARLAGARVDKIYQPAAELFVLRLWTGSANLKLLISAAAQDSRLTLTEESFANPFTPPRFCQLLRARLSRVISVTQVNADRIVRIECSGPKGICLLMVELTGRSSNLVLVDEAGMVIDALKRSRGAQVRTILAGKRYQLPEKSESLNRPTAAGTDKISGAAVPKDLKFKLNQVLHKEMKRLKRRLENIEREFSKQQDFDCDRQSGDLILANIGLIEKGQAEASLVNYYRQPAVEERVMLDPLLTPQQNAQRYFKKYKKARSGLEHSRRRKDETEAEINWLADIEFQLASTCEPALVAEIASELKQAGLLKEQLNRLPRESGAGKKKLYNETLSPNGFNVLWGTSSRQNDALSTKFLKKGDLWFHAHRYPGSHVVIKANPELGGFAEADLTFAAALAAARSKAQGASKVEVMVAEAGAVRKPPGARPGMVTVRKFKSLVVQPFSEMIAEN